MSVLPGVEERCRHAIAALERLLQEHPENLERDVNDATRTLVALRNDLIARTRGGEAAYAGHLTQVNSTLSILMAGHYPVEGVRWDCIRQARDALERLVPTPER